MNCIAMIPARYASTRFPAKLMQSLGNKTVIRHTYDNTVKTCLFDMVVVVTDSQVIFDEISSHDGDVMMSIRTHESGSDRIAEAVENLETDIVVNVQGDEPFVQAAPLEKLLDLFRKDETEKIQVASLMQVIKDKQNIQDPNYVKVVVDLEMNALYFSRSIVPFLRDQSAVITYYEHIGVYAFRKQALMSFTRWPVSPLESVEKIECLRYLEHGIPLKMVLTEYMGVEIDTPEDLLLAKQRLS
jgi:3-deoxy-manno-octulosonate cytidylyltransferase (CMP-KDO synthetase)